MEAAIFAKMFIMHSIKPKKALLFLLSCIGLLLILHIASYINFYVNDLEVKEFFFRKLNLSSERNVPSIFSSFILFIASILLFSIAFSQLKISNNKTLWIFLGILFLFLSLDELLRIHEKIGRWVNKSIETTGIFHYAWVIPYGICLLILSIACFKPLMQLPKETLRNFIISGVIFVSGALGLEMLAGWYIENVADWYISNELITGKILHRSIPVFIMYTLEELLEMLGVTYFIYSILKFRNKYVILKSD